MQLHQLELRAQELLLALQRPLTFERHVLLG